MPSGARIRRRNLDSPLPVFEVPASPCPNFPPTPPIRLPLPSISRRPHLEQAPRSRTSSHGDGASSWSRSSAAARCSSPASRSAAWPAPRRARAMGGRTCSGRSGTRTTTSARTMSARVDPSILVEGAIKGMFEALDDPFSAYLTEEEYRSSLGGLSGEFEGVGIEMATHRRRGRAVRDRLRHVPPDGHARHSRLTRDRCRTAGRRRRRRRRRRRARLDQTLDLVVPTIRGPKGSDGHA